MSLYTALQVTVYKQRYAFYKESVDDLINLIPM